MDLKDRQFRLTKNRLEALDRLHIHTAEELLSYYPFRYDVLSAPDISLWKEKDKVTFEAEVVSAVRSWRHGRLTTSSFDVMAYDRVLKVTIFNRPWARNLTLNQIITISGIYNGKNKVTAMSYDTKPLAEHDAVTPVYNTAEGIKQKTIRACIERVYETLENEIMDLVPREFISAYRLLRKQEALRRVHFPQSMDDVRSAVRTLKYEEFLRFFTAVELMKNEDSHANIRSPRLFDMRKVNAVIRKMPFALTPDQSAALNEILHDLGSTAPMYRLVQGDVGCGKTAVAALAMYAAVTSGCQAALLAPTEILARQHLESMQKLLAGADIRIEVLYSGLSASEKRRILAETADGTVDILIGTHSLIQDAVEFKNLGMVVADEQQRFGVAQRKALRSKGTGTDFLLMSATPIPRTLASTLYGDMDVSTIETMPAGRKTPKTVYIEENSFRTVLKDVQALLAQGHQLYIICAAVDFNEAYEARNVIETAGNIRKLFPQYRVDILHGRMSSEEKQEAMNRFYRNETQILVSTTVVEVGMNVINATGMIVYDADRFGLSQLHQLRGRIQRGSSQGICWLLSSSQEEKVHERLNVLVRTNNGFEISYEDLRLRGPGDILGTRQSGVPDFILGNLITDTGIINTARSDARKIISNPENPDYIPLLETVRDTSRNSASYAD